MKRWTFLVCLSASVFSAAAAPLNKNSIDADARWVLHLDLEAFRQSKLGTLILTDIQTQFGEKIQALQELIGSNVLTDFNHFTLYGPDHQEQNAVLLAEGRFSQQKLLALLMLNPQYQKSTYGNYILHEWFAQHHGKYQIGTFARDNLIAISQNPQALQQALDVLDGKRPPLTHAPWLSGNGRAPATPILLGAACGVKELTAGQPQAALLANTQTVFLSVSENNGSFQIQILLQTDNPQTALRLEQAVLGMKAFLALSQAASASAAGTSNSSPLAVLLDNCRLIREENAVLLQMEMPSESVYQVLQQWHQARSGAAQPNP